MLTKEGRGGKVTSRWTSIPYSRKPSPQNTQAGRATSREWGTGRGGPLSLKSFRCRLSNTRSHEMVFNVFFSLRVLDFRETWGEHHREVIPCSCFVHTRGWCGQQKRNREVLGSDFMETSKLSNESPQNKLGALCSTTAQI